MTRPVHGGNLTWAAALAGCPAAAILDFSASISPLGPPESAKRAIESHLSDLGAYPDPDYYQLRVALSQVHTGLSPEWILPGNGAAELLTWAAFELSNLAGTYLVTPAFGDYRRALKTFDATVLECSMDLGLEVLDLRSPFENFPSQIPSKTGLLLNNPHNPTGLLFTLEAIAPFLEKFALVVVDEAFMDFLPPAQQQSLVGLVAEFPNLVILRSLTKFYSLPGLRLGYAIAHPDRIRRWQQWRDPWPVNTLAAAAAAAVVQDSAFQQQTWDWLDLVRPQLFEGLGKLPGLQPYKGAANFLFVRSEHSVSWIQKTLLERHRILIRDCLSFPELGDRFFRVAIRTEADNNRLLAGLADVLK
ncbi:threonine-phosphate decarboxylase CobD [Kamptonema sp. UHCC 0994]|uniref:threonine-phosphate decarboxylase CobD n=1 Tax=Kamptonema sp. UHCC 0994 TaxID=3031329 RepID=UPI0023BA00AA|nr:threonine-phosphate decarboxylase CobD [Kamptonema sp. UHCC 0994]MDF0554134.1 threonine-phosphate decarboxylase CobD [Kamptonema sp. UHCC 0994]